VILVSQYTEKHVFSSLVTNLVSRVVNKSAKLLDINTSVNDSNQTSTILNISNISKHTTDYSDIDFEGDLDKILDTPIPKGWEVIDF
jgi:hypothetical protein